MKWVLVLSLVTFIHSGANAESYKGRYIKSVADSDFLEEGDQACVIVLEPKVGTFVGLFSPKKADCFTKDEKNETELDKTLRGKEVSASGVENLSEKEAAFVGKAKQFWDAPKKTEFKRLTKSYKVGGSIVKGKLHAYDCKEVASEGTESTFNRLKVNATALFLSEKGEDDIIGVPDSTYRKSAPDLHRYKFGAVSGCPYDLEATIQEAAFKRKESVEVRASCPGGDSPAWVRLKCDPADNE